MILHASVGPPSYDSSFDAVKIKIRQNVPLNFCVYSFTVASDKSEHFVFFRRRRQCDQIIDISYTWTAYWPRQTAFVDSSSYVAYHHITCFSAICRACVLMPLHAVSWLLYSDLPKNYFFKFYGPDVGIKSSPILLKFYSKSWQVFWLLLSPKPFKIVQSGNTVLRLKNWTLIQPLMQFRAGRFWSFKMFDQLTSERTTSRQVLSTFLP